MPVVAGLTLTLGDRVRETTQTTGTGTYSLDGAPSGKRTFVSGIGSGQKCLYTVELAPNWEVGVGTVTSGAPATLSRDSIRASSNAGSAVNWGSGVKDVFVDISAELANQIFALGAQNWSATWGGTSGGSAQTQTITPSPAINAYASGEVFAFIPGFANTAANPTLNVNGKGALTIKTPGGGNIGIGDLQTGKLYLARHDGTNLRLQTLYPTIRNVGLGGGFTFRQIGTIRTGASTIIAGMNGVSTNGTSAIVMQLGYGGGSFQSSGYGGPVTTSAAVVAGTVTAASSFSGAMNWTHAGGNTWTWTSLVVNGADGSIHTSAGVVGVSGEVDAIAIASLNGADTFDAGILYCTVST